MTGRRPGSDDEVGDHDTSESPICAPCGNSRPTLHYRTIHGYRRAFRVAGSGPAILLIHGIGDNSTTWSTVQSKLAQRFTVIAPDLLGHGKSDKPRADYSVAAYANGMRDLLSVLDIERVTVVGHSLGGGVAMQFAYQFPQLVDRLILVGAGGVTKDVNVALRIASLPMGSEALALLRLPLVLPALQVVGPRWRARCSAPPALGRDLPDVLRILADLPEPTASSAFARTLRAVVDWRGQVVTMLDRCYLTRIRSRAIDLGFPRLGDPGQPRADGARRDARLAAGDLRGLRALPVPRRSRTASSRSSSGSSVPPNRPCTTRSMLRSLLRDGHQRGRDHRIGRHPGRGARRDGRRRAQRHLTVDRASPT